ncbi:hypothetical protein EON66_10530, partial [archaeon]
MPADRTTQLHAWVLSYESCAKIAHMLGGDVLVCVNTSVVPSMWPDVASMPAAVRLCDGRDQVSVHNAATSASNRAAGGTGRCNANIGDRGMPARSDVLHGCSRSVHDGVSTHSSGSGNVGDLRMSAGVRAGVSSSGGGDNAPLGASCVNFTRGDSVASIHNASGSSVASPAQHGASAHQLPGSHAVPACSCADGCPCHFAQHLQAQQHQQRQLQLQQLQGQYSKASAAIDQSVDVWLVSSSATCLVEYSSSGAHTAAAAAHGEPTLLDYDPVRRLVPISSHAASEADEDDEDGDEDDVSPFVVPPQVVLSGSSVPHGADASRDSMEAVPSIEEADVANNRCSGGAPANGVRGIVSNLEVAEREHFGKEAALATVDCLVTPSSLRVRCPRSPKSVANDIGILPAQLSPLAPA